LTASTATPSYSSIRCSQYLTSTLAYRSCAWRIWLRRQHALEDPGRRFFSVSPTYVLTAADRSIQYRPDPRAAASRTVPKPAQAAT
jgi:hypothetical protein